MNLLEQLQQTHISKNEIEHFNKLLGQFEEVCQLQTKKTQELRAMATMVDKLESFRQQFPSGGGTRGEEAAQAAELMQGELLKISKAEQETEEQLLVLRALRDKLALLEGIVE